jgi:hypothetical protein
LTVNFSNQSSEARVRIWNLKLGLPAGHHQAITGHHQSVAHLPAAPGLELLAAIRESLGWIPEERAWLSD